MADEKPKGEKAAQVKKRAPTLYVIIAIKLIKGLLLLLLAFGVYKISGRDLPELFGQLLAFFHLAPERKFFADLAEKIETLSAAKLVWLAGGTFLYSLFSLVEGVGLIFRIKWAGWLAIGESAFFIPIEVFELVHRGFSWKITAILGLNVLDRKSTRLNSS